MQCEFTGRKIVSHLDFTEQTERVHQALRSIGAALNACNNTVATDRLDAEPDISSWRVDNNKELLELSWLSSFLKDIGIYRGCTCCNIDRLTERQGNS